MCVLIYMLFFMQGTKCDVRNAEDVKNLVSFAQEKLKYIDIWVLVSNLFSFCDCLFCIYWWENIAKISF